ncbi:DUF4265 domain-containing protein [Paucibacter sp. B51]|uniref:DUF4265 domain-containing protein n=1 Tax=Paucibacter sp. B51 TaxID=2993315 RepID=UPI0022EBCF4B|nr:DUF4265 domain-containing protein [Paucibacter sp. B51]
MEKLRFALDIEDEWPPVATESVWCERSGNLYVLKNAPFFIKGLAFGDGFTAEPDPVNGCIFEFEVIETSGNSLVWVLNTDNLDFSGTKDELSALGCQVEGFPQFNLFSVDVPASADADAVNALVDRIEERGYALAFPVWRHEASGA